MPHTFTPDVEELAQRLIEAFDLTFEEHEQKLADPVIRWLDYRLRYIDPRPRTTAHSIGFAARVPAQVSEALSTFTALSEAGADLNPYQSKTIKGHDTSGIKRQRRTDGLWADWGIHHVHLTELLASGESEFSERSGWLLLFLAWPDQLALIDVRAHSETGIFESVDLVEIAIRSWPSFASRFEVRGVLGLARPPATDADSVKKLRQSGIAQMIEVDGVVYIPPGAGVTAAATATRVSLLRNRVKQLARHIGDHLTQPDSALVVEAGTRGLVDPIVSLRVLPDGRLTAVCEQAASYAPFPTGRPESDARAELQELLLPSWAGARLVSYFSAQTKDGPESTVPVPLH
jgi:hypothetical protein